MKTIHLPFALLYAATVSFCGAFSLDAVGYEGGDLAPCPLTMMVPGYGELVLESDQGLMLVLNPAYSNGACCVAPPLKFDQADAVKVSFHEGSGGLPVDGPLADASVSQSSSAGTWSEIPEPASAGLGLIGLILLFFARRR
jgi:MYXO-CTERM domain-containing protein